MKKISFFLLASLLSAGVYAQNAVDAAMEQQMIKDKEKSDKAITDGKASGKAATWMTRAQTYQQIAQTALKLDSNAANVAYEAYAKAAELDTKDGKEGKVAKEAKEAMKGQGMYAAFMNAGAAKYQNKNFGDAARMMGRAGEINPKDTTAALYTGIAFQQANDAASAKPQFERYIENGGKDPSVYYTLANLYRQEKDVDKALATLDKGITATGGNKDLTAERVNVLVNSGRTDEALKGMQALAEKDPNNATNWLNLAILYGNSADKTKEQLKKATEGSKRGPQLDKQLASQKEALATMQTEATRLTARAKKEPKNAEVKRQLTSVNEMISDKKADIASTEEQIKTFKDEQAKSAGQVTESPDVLTKRLEEQRGMAMQYTMKALQIDPNSYDANFNVAVAYFNDAVEMKHQVDSMDMKEYQARGKEVEGRVCGMFKKSLPYFEKAKSIRGDDTELNNNLENLRNILKQFEEKKIVCVDPK